MSDKCTFNTTWDADNQLLSTQINGLCNLDTIKNWEASLNHTLNSLSNESTFKIMVDLMGFTAENFEAHKYFRNIVPLTLANYNWKTGYVNMFEEGKNLSLKSTRGIRCTAAVHVHHDASKIGLYQEKYSSKNENFYTDVATARNWIMLQ